MRNLTFYNISIYYLWSLPFNLSFKIDRLCLQHLDLLVLQQPDGGQGGDPGGEQEWPGEEQECVHQSGMWPCCQAWHQVHWNICRYEKLCIFSSFSNDIILTCNKEVEIMNLQILITRNGTPCWWIVSRNLHAIAVSTLLYVIKVEKMNVYLS